VSRRSLIFKASVMIFTCTPFIQALVAPVFKVYPVKPLTTEPLDKDVAEEFPSIAAVFESFQDSFKTSTEVCGQTCVYLATGKAKHVLKGKYFDCEQNIQTVVDHAAEVKEKDLYDLKVEFLGGLPNDGGTSKQSH
jgi:hypothetical protein